MGKLDGKVALISGGARGQGAAEAETFVKEGAKVGGGVIAERVLQVDTVAPPALVREALAAAVDLIVSPESHGRSARR